MSTRHRLVAFAAFALLLLTAIGGLSAAPTGQAAVEIDAVILNLPKGFVGEFQWDNDRVIQHVAIRWRNYIRGDT